MNARDTIESQIEVVTHAPYRGADLCSASRTAKSQRAPDEVASKPPPESELKSESETGGGGGRLSDFWAYLPEHRYIYEPTRDLWPAASVDGRVSWPTGANGKKVRPTNYLDAHRAVEQMTWHPDEPQVITDRVVQAGGWAAHPGARVFNLYRAPNKLPGDADQASPWLEHLQRIYPEDWQHILFWLAHRVQKPGEKCNHALVLGGDQGIGKDTLLEPVKAAVGPWNWSDISPVQLLGRFNGWAKSVVVRVNEARDLGDVDRFALYDHSKTYIAAPPDVVRVDEKHTREYPVFNVMGVLFTTNHRTDGLFLPADDRRHFVAWSELNRAAFDAEYWNWLWRWYYAGGIGHVAAYLRTLDLSAFDPKAPPPRTPAFWATVQAGSAPEDGELHDVVERAGNPSALTLVSVVSIARAHGMNDLADELSDRKNRRQLPHKFDRAGYVPVRNPDADDGMWKIGGKRQAVYVLKTLAVADQVRAARGLR